ncbi:MAG: YigZ family protein, partial [Spirochaetales bacterium]|nr:YigZ family protein [Spirochaetales bacterium]
MLIPLHTISVEIVIKKSKFIAIAVPIESADQAKNIISLTKKEHPDASHVVHAYILGKNRDIFSMSDDREPRNTAGRPVLEVLKGSGIT